PGRGKGYTRTGWTTRPTWVNLPALAPARFVGGVAWGGAADERGTHDRVDHGPRVDRGRRHARDFAGRAVPPADGRRPAERPDGRARRRRAGERRARRAAASGGNPARVVREAVPARAGRGAAEPSVHGGEGRRRQARGRRRARSGCVAGDASGDGAGGA